MRAPEKAAKETLMQKPQTVLRLGTVNVGTLIGRSAEAVETLGRKNVDICALQEVRYKKEDTKLVNGGEYNYKLCGWVRRWAKEVLQY